MESPIAAALLSNAVQMYCTNAQESLDQKKIQSQLM